MNLESIKNLDKEQIKEAVGSIREKFRLLRKDFFSLPYAKAYLIVTPFLVLFFTVATFPFEIIIKNELRTLEGSVFKAVQPGYMSISPFGTGEIESLTFVTKGRSEILLNKARFNISTLALLSQKLSGDFSMEQFRFTADTTSANFRLNNGVSDILLDTVQGMPKGGTFHFSLSEFSFKGLTLPVIGEMPSVKNSTVKTSLSFSPRLMTIQECIISGKDLSGNIRGSIALDANFQRSQLNLTIEVDPRSSFIENMEPFTREMIKTKINPTTGNITFNVTGTVSDPNIAQNPQGAGMPSFPGMPPAKR